MSSVLLLLMWRKRVFKNRLRNQMNRKDKQLRDAQRLFALGVKPVQDSSPQDMSDAEWFARHPNKEMQDA